MIYETSGIMLVMPPRKKQITEPVNEAAIEPVIQPEESPEDQQPVIQEDTFTFKRSHFYAVMTVLAFAAGVLLGYVAWGMEPAGGSVQTANQAAVANAPAAAEQQLQRYDIPIGDA